MHKLLILFICLRLLKRLCEYGLQLLNKRYYENPEHQNRAKDILKITDGDMDKSLTYTRDKHHFATVSTWLNEILTLVFVAIGGFGYIELFAQQQSFAWFGSANEIATGLLFFAVLALIAMLVSLPFKYYHSFVLEERHGFNRATLRSFVLDIVKGVAVAAVLGAVLLIVLMLIIDRTGTYWWVYGWLFMTGFMLFTAWIYPTVLAPLFNKFTEIADGDLKTNIFSFADRVGFKTSKIYIMDASKRTTHGNAYFTGIFGEKRIVLFDTLVSVLTPKQAVAVLAHEIGHYKLHHTRWALVRGFIETGVLFYLLSLVIAHEGFYQAFALSSASSYGALLVFSMWFGLADFIITPIGNYISRRNEFAADRYAKKHLGSGKDLQDGLLKMREKSSAMPICHPLYSNFYHTHPPIIERVKALA